MSKKKKRYEVNKEIYLKLEKNFNDIIVEIKITKLLNLIYP